MPNMAPASQSRIANGLSDIAANPSAAVLGLVGLIILYVAGRAFYNIFLHPLRKFPGPPFRAAFWFINYLDEINLTQHVNAKKFHEKYGPVVRLAPDTLSFISAQAWKDIYASKGGKHELEKDFKFYTQNTNGASSLLVSRHDDHVRIRRLVINSFSDAALRSMEPLTVDYVEKLMSKLNDSISNPLKHGVNDMAEWFYCLTFDIMADLCFTESFNAVDNGAFHPWMHTILESAHWGGPIRFLRAYPIIGMIAKAVKYITSGTTEINTARKEHMKYSIEKTERRLNMDIDRADVVTPILKKNTEKGMTRAEIAQTIILMLLGGTEPTATALTGIVYNLLTNPQTLAKLVSEVDATYKSASEITNAKCNTSMPYMNAVIQESLRIVPPAPCKFPRRTGPEGHIIDGHFIPGDMSVGVHQLASFHSSSNFHRPMDFVPERWLESPPAEFKNDARDALWPFSTGPRNCIGKPMAYMQIRHTLCRLLLDFNMELDPSARDWPNMKADLFWRMQPLKVKLSRRAT